MNKIKNTIAFITDVHLDEEFVANHGVKSRENWQLILDDVASRRINNIVIGGDIGEKDSNEFFFFDLGEA